MLLLLLSLLCIAGLQSPTLLLPAYRWGSPATFSWCTALITQSYPPHPTNHHLPPPLPPSPLFPLSTGAYYFYQPEVGKDFETTILDVLATARATHVPYATIQFDSWWYLQDHNVSASIPAPLLLWEPRADVFPSGMTPWVGRPLVLHNRMFSPHSAYHAMGYEFINEPGASLALPVDKKMFTYIMAKAVRWGMIMYEQDWLSYTFTNLNATQRNFTAAARWLDALGGAAADLNVTVQFCMALASMALHSTTLPAVTNARASGDYHPSSNLPPAYTENWQIGLTSLLLDALGLQPSKDTMWSGEVQPGSRFDPNTEPNTSLHAIAAVLSTGPVGFSDGVGFANTALIARTCRADGLLLRPDAPAAHLDAALVAGVVPVVVAAEAGGASASADSGAVPYIVAAPVTLGGYTWTLLLAAELNKTFTLALSEDLPQQQQQQPSGGVVVVDWFAPATPTALPAGGTLALQPGQGCPPPACGPTAVAFRYLLVAPLLEDGWAYLGEAAKFVPVSQFRTASFAPGAGGGGFTAGLIGAPGDGNVTVAARAPSGARVLAVCDVATSGAARLTCGGAMGSACACAASE